MPCLPNVLTVLGGVAEISGLSLVVIEIVRMQRREIPEHRVWVVRWLAAARTAGRALVLEARLTLRGVPRAETKHVTSPAYITGSASAHAGGHVVLSTGTPSLAERVERLETEIKRMNDQAAKDRERLRDVIWQAKAHTDASAAELRGMIEERDRQREEGVRDALTLQWVGTGMFVLGVVLGALGNLVPC